MPEHDFSIERGVRAAHLAPAASLFWGAFGAKLGFALGPDRKAEAFLHRVMDPAYAVSAVDREGALLGVAGFKTPEGGFVGGEWADLVAIYGRISATWRAGTLSILERDCVPGILLMDGIFVTPAARGRGVGSSLLEAVVAEAVRRDLAAVRLDVIDTNPRARALYERRGFRAVDETRLGLLRHIFGFSSSAEMHRPV